MNFYERRLNWLPLRFLVQNLGWILLSLLLAFLLWIVASLQENPIEQRTFSEALPVTILEDSDVVHLPGTIDTQRVQVTIRASRRSWEVLRRSDIQVVADLRGLEVGVQRVQLQGRIINDNLQARVVSLYPDNFVVVEMQPLRERIIRIVPEVQSEPPRGYTYAAPVCNPNQITISGPEALVDSVAVARVRLRLQDLTESVTRTLNVVLENNEGAVLTNLKSNTTSITCQVDIQRREGTLRVQPVVIGAPPEDYQIESIRAEPDEVFVEGDSELIASLAGVVETEAIDVNGQTSSFSRAVVLNLPTGLVLVPNTQIITVRVTIVPKLDRIPFSEVPVQIVNLNPQLNAVLIPDKVSIIILGPAPLVRDLTLEDFVVFVDLQGLGVGQYTDLPLEILLLRDTLVGVVEVTIQPSGVDASLNLAPTLTPSPSLSPSPSIFGKF